MQHGGDLLAAHGAEPLPGDWGIKAAEIEKEERPAEEEENGVDYDDAKEDVSNDE